MKMFITGAAGFIGSNYVRWLMANSDVEITVFDALTYAGIRENLAEFDDSTRFNFVHGDVTDRDSVATAMPGHTHVVHFAAESHVDRLGHDRRYSIDTSKVRELGWAPQHDFETALDETVGWYHDNRAWWEPLKVSVKNR